MALDARSYDLDEEPYDAHAAQDTFPLGRSLFFWTGRLDPQEHIKVYESRPQLPTHAILTRTSC